MLKLYVETMIRLNGSTQRLKSSIQERSKGESGFVSAETIGLAVAGVLLVGVIYVAFKDKINDQINTLFDKMGKWGDDSSTTTG